MFCWLFDYAGQNAGIYYGIGREQIYINEM